MIRDTDCRPKTVTREPLPEVLRGNPERTEALIDASRHQWTYRAGVISFADSDNPTEDQQAEVMDQFERLAFAGLDPEQYEVLWVRHRHEGRVELHFCTPRLELTTGKSLNIALARKHGIWLFNDEIFHGLGRSGATHLPFVADAYERGLSLGVMSKSYRLPGLRVGWIACQDREVVGRMERLKHYLSICNGGPSERLALVALKAKDRILARNNAIIDANLPLWDAFFARHDELFEWRRPDGSCMGYPRYLSGDVGAWCERLVREAGVLLLPSTIYRSALGDTPVDRFRLGYGRAGLAEGIAALEAAL